MDLAEKTTSSSLLVPKKKVDLVWQASKPQNSHDGMLPRRRGSGGSNYHSAVEYGQNHPSYRKETSKEKIKNKFVAQSNFNEQKSMLPPTASLSMDWEQRKLEDKSNKSVEFFKQVAENKPVGKRGEISTDSLVSMVCGSPAFFSCSIPAAGKESPYGKVSEFNRKEKSSDLYGVASSDKIQDENDRLMRKKVMEDIHLESKVGEKVARNPLMRSISTESLMHEISGLEYSVKRRISLVPERVSHSSSTEDVLDHGSTSIMTEYTKIDDTFALWTFIPVLAVIGCLSLLYSSALSFGALLGGAVAFVFLRSYAWFMHPTVVKVYIPSVDAPLVDLPEHSVKTVPRNLNESAELKAKVFTGWLNLLDDVKYIPELYHISNTTTIHATLDYTVLKMQKPQTEVPKRAMWNESDHNVNYVKQATVDVRNYRVELLPKELVKSRIWSKKYPICLIHHGLDSVCNPLTANEFAVLDSHFTSPQRIFLFARTNKEKEEWFRRLDQACRGQPITTLISELQRWKNADIQSQLQNEQENLTNRYQLSADVKPDTSKRHRRSSSEGSSQNISSTASKLSARKLASRNHNVLLVEHIKCLMSVMEKCSKFEPSTAGRSEATSNKISTGTTLSPSASAIQRDSSANKEKRSISPSRFSSFLSFGKNKLARAQLSSPADSTASSPVSNAAEDKPEEKASPLHCDTGVLWVNVFLQRIFFDFFREEYWKLRMQSKIQKKLDKINLPYYIDQLILSEINLGKNLPLIKHIGQPYFSDNGLWLDSQIAYDGGVTMTIETKINLISLKKGEGVAGRLVKEDKKKEAVPVSAITDEDADDSEESSTSTDESVQSSPEGVNRVTRLFNQLKESKYFQQLANTRLIRSAIDKVSNTKLKLSVELKYLAGTFCVNIPPPPTDRIWFGFRDNPELILCAKPVVGEKSVNVAKLSEWIERKMNLEFQRLLVIPNMVDQQIHIMCGHYTPRSSSKKRYRKNKMRTSRSDMSTTTEHMMC